MVSSLPPHPPHPSLAGKMEGRAEELRRVELISAIISWPWARRLLAENLLEEEVRYGNKGGRRALS